MLVAKIKLFRMKYGISREELGTACGVSKQTIFKYETGIITNIPLDKVERMAEVLHIPAAQITGWSNPAPATTGAALISFPVIAAVKAGYDGSALEEYTGTQEAIPAEDLHGRSPEDFMVLRVNGNSMYPLLLDGDRILVERTTSVDSGSLAVVLYNGEEATVKRVRYKYGEDWLELIPQNPEYPPKRIEGPDLEECRVLGRVLKLIRTLE